MFRFVVVMALGISACASTEPESCTVEETDGGAVIRCPDGSRARVEPGADGEDGANAEACTIEDNADGTRRLVCPDGTSVDLEGDEPVTCAGSFQFEDAADLAVLVPCDEVDGSLRLQYGTFESLDAIAGIRIVSGLFGFMNATVVEQPLALQSVGGLSLLISDGFSSLGALLPALTNLGPASNGCGGGITIQETALETLSLSPSLGQTGDPSCGSIAVIDNPLLPQCEVDELAAQLGTTCQECSGNAACP